MAMPGVNDYSMVAEGPSGGIGGNRFDDTSLGQLPVPFTFQVWFNSSYIRGIQSFDGPTYMHGTPDTSGCAGQASPQTFALQSGEYVTAVNGTFNNFSDGVRVTSITILTNLNSVGYSYGPGGGVDFQYGIPAGMQLMCFIGRSGLDIDALGAVIAIPQTKQVTVNMATGTPQYTYVNSQGTQVTNATTCDVTDTVPGQQNFVFTLDSDSLQSGWTITGYTNNAAPSSPLTGAIQPSSTCTVTDSGSSGWGFTLKFSKGGNSSSFDPTVQNET